MPCSDKSYTVAYCFKRSTICRKIAKKESNMRWFVQRICSVGYLEVIGVEILADARIVTFHGKASHLLSLHFTRAKTNDATSSNGSSFVIGLFYGRLTHIRRQSYRNISSAEEISSIQPDGKLIITL